MQILSKAPETIRKREDYYFFKEHGICTVCHQEMAEARHTMCLACRMDHNERSHTENRSAESIYAHQQHLKRRRELNLAFGVCTTCGKRDASPGTSTCERCRAKSRERSKNKRIANGVISREDRDGMGVCYFCGTPTMDGKKVCQKCYARLKIQMLHARCCRQETNNFERLCKNNYAVCHLQNNLFAKP